MNLLLIERGCQCCSNKNNSALYASLEAKLIIGVRPGQFEGGLRRATAIEFIRNALFLSSEMNKKQSALILFIIFVITVVLEAATTS